jgi:hypothetical protein
VPIKISDIVLILRNTTRLLPAARLEQKVDAGIRNNDYGGSRSGNDALAGVMDLGK